MANFKNYRSKHKGHLIKLDDSLVVDENMTIMEYNKKHGIPSWIYCDTLQPLSKLKDCIQCGAMCTDNEPDPCLGYIEGVTGACCGHGDDNRKYINFDEYSLRGEEVNEFIKKIQT